jgi:hypothetical protein
MLDLQNIIDLQEPIKGAVLFAVKVIPGEKRNAAISSLTII